MLRLIRHRLSAQRKFQKISRSEKTVLEIGPFNKPCVTGPNVAYFDVMTTEQLRERAVQVGRDPSTVPHIPFVSHDGDMSIVSQKFTGVVSSHCVEHQTDLIRHFNQVADVLEPGGKYYLIIPDKRYCFDHFIGETTLQSVLDSRGDTRHPLQKVIEHRAYTTHNRSVRHWLGDHHDNGWVGSISHRTALAVEEYERAAGGYIDVHRWQFTPSSFAHIVNALYELGLIRLRLARKTRTPILDLQFTAILQLDDTLKS